MLCSSRLHHRVYRMKQTISISTLDWYRSSTTQISLVMLIIKMREWVKSFQEEYKLTQPQLKPQVLMQRFGSD